MKFLLLKVYLKVDNAEQVKAMCKKKKKIYRMNRFCFMVFLCL